VPACRIERAISSKRVVSRTGKVMVLEDPGQPAGRRPRNPAHDSSRRRFGRFISDKCLTAPGMSVRFSELFTA
jgi:hypothetical protein